MSTEVIELSAVEAVGRMRQGELSAEDYATALLARTEGILADPIYTAKALAGLVGLARAGHIAGKSVVFWHGGGTTGLFEELEGWPEELSEARGFVSGGELEQFVERSRLSGRSAVARLPPALFP